MRPAFCFSKVVVDEQFGLWKLQELAKEILQCFLQAKKYMRHAWLSDRIAVEVAINWGCNLCSLSNM